VTVSWRDWLSQSALAWLGWLAVAAVNAMEIALLPAVRGGAAVRLQHLGFDFGQTLALGVVAGAVAGLWNRFGPARAVWTYVAAFIAALLLGRWVLADDLDGFVERFDRSIGVGLASWLAVAALAVIPPALLALGRRLARGYWTLVGVALGVLLLGANTFVLVDGYHGVHAWIAGSAATLLSASLARADVKSRLGARLSARGALVLALTNGCVSAAGVLVEPPSRVRLALLERDTALLAPWLTSVHGTKAKRLDKVRVPPELGAWYESRAKRPDVPPSPERLLPEGPIVVFVSIDALRQEVLGRDGPRIAPTLAEMKKTGVYFSQARSSGSDTRFSLACLFSGRYLSQLRWNHASRARPTLERDLLPRLPELLEPHEVTTITGVSLPNMLVSRFGIVRGFDEEFVKEEGVGKKGTVQVVDHAIERLKRQGPGPLFYFTHLIDPHQPYYKHGNEQLPPHEAYLAEVTYADLHLGRLRRAIHELGLAHRTALIVSSDHGEGFGEHGIYFHNKALYEVMVHVPVLMELPGVSPRVIDAHVSLMDVGATVLDLFGVAKPGYWMSESLVPLLLGKKSDPARPIYMERMNERALLFGDGIKVLLREKPRSEEIYDLRRDPHEEENLRESLGQEGDRRVALVRAYGAAHGSTKLTPEE
jgi:hypothetical protein